MLGWYKKEGDRMNGCCHGDNLRILLINSHTSYIVTEDIVSLMDMWL